VPAQKYTLNDWIRAICKILGRQRATDSRWFVQAAKQLTATQPKLITTPSLKLMNSVALLLKKSKCWIWIAMHSTFD
jgi:hypothetical protein